MKDFLYADTTPLDEPCIQAGNNYDFQKLEARAIINQIERTFGPFPEGFYISVNKNFHEAGMYLDLKLWYLEGVDEEETSSMAFALKLEGEWPKK